MATATFKKGIVQTAKYTAAADIAVDEVVIMGTATDGTGVGIGVARAAIANGDTGPVAVSGVFEFPKVSAAVIVAGEPVSWDASEGGIEDKALSTAAGDVASFGTAMENAGNGVTVIDVDIKAAGTYDGV